MSDIDNDAIARGGRLSQAEVSELRAALVGVTSGEWRAGHLSDDAHSCDCASVLSEGYMGAVATVHFNNDLPVGEGGNDAPPLSEAKANQRYIAVFGPETAEKLLSERDALLARIAELETAASRILPYLVWTVGEESPGHHPTLPSAVSAFKAATRLPGRTSTNG